MPSLCLRLRSEFLKDFEFELTVDVFHCGLDSDKLGCSTEVDLAFLLFANKHLVPAHLLATASQRLDFVDVAVGRIGEPRVKNHFLSLPELFEVLHLDQLEGLLRWRKSHGRDLRSTWRRMQCCVKIRRALRWSFRKW